MVMLQDLPPLRQSLVVLRLLAQARELVDAGSASSGSKNMAMATAAPLLPAILALGGMAAAIL